MSEIFQLFFHYANALWKRRWFILLGAWAVAIPGWLAVASMPSIYQSSSRIYVDTTNVLQPLLRGIAVPSNLDAQVQLMKQTLLSRPNLLEVARKTDYDLTARGPAEMESLLASIQGRTSVASNREDIFWITYEDSNPERARDVVQALLTIFVESNLGQSRQDLDTAQEFIDNQIADYEARLEESEDRLARFKQQHIDVVLGEGSYLSRATAANSIMERFEEDLNVAIAQRNLLRSELESIPETLPNALGSAGPPDDTQYRIVELEVQLRQLLSQFTEKHPDVISLQRQLEALLAKQQETRMALLEAADGSVTPTVGDGSFGTPNPMYSQIKLQLIQIETQIENLRRRAATARAEAEALAAKAEEVPRVEAEFQRLNRDYDIIKARHDDLLSRRESARMSRSRDAVGQEVQYRLIEPPVVASSPIGPNRPLFLTAVLVFAVGAGSALALLLVILDTSFSSIVELRTYTGIPVLGSVTDTRRRTAQRFVDTVALGSAAFALAVVYGLLLLAERQYGLDTIMAAGPDGNIFEQATRLVLQMASDLLSWVRGLVQF
ncbi:MAG: XrtA system polysaccharide chain length determinant [Kiloniellaceae bacterium]